MPGVGEEFFKVPNPQSQSGGIYVGVDVNFFVVKYIGIQKIFYFMFGVVH